MWGRGGRNQVDSLRNQNKDKGSTSKTRGFCRGGRFEGWGGSGGFRRRCFHCNEVGHESFKCPRWIDPNKAKERGVNLTKEEVEDKSKIIPHEEGECLLMRNGGSTLPLAQESIFISRCLIKGYVFNLIF